MSIFERSPINPRIDLYSGTAALTPTRFGDLPALLVRFKASIDNAGKVFIATREDAYPDDVYELPAGDDTGWLVCPNTQTYFYLVETVGDVVSSWIIN